MHRLGGEDKSRLHADIGRLEDTYYKEKNHEGSWYISDTPLIRLDLCQKCYNELIGRIRDLRVAGGLVPDLTEVCIDGSSI
jgi:hypothetical protein